MTVAFLLFSFPATDTDSDDTNLFNIVYTTSPAGSIEEAREDHYRTVATMNP
jgi:hypothetical protein